MLPRIKLIGPRGYTNPNGVHLLLLLILPLFAAQPLLGARHNDAADDGVTVQVSASEADVLQAVQEVAQESLIHGTYVYEKDKRLTGAHAASSSPIYGEWQGPGRAFYKVADGVLDPRHFHASNGTGTVAIRYVVQGVGPTTTSLRIDAVFVEDSRRRKDRSDGTVEAAEYDAINERLEAITQERQEAQAAAQQIAEQRAAAQHAGEQHAAQEATAQPVAPAAAKQQTPAEKSVVVAEAPKNVKVSNTVATGSIPQLEREVAELRRQVEARVREDGTALRAAPYSRASMIRMLHSGTEVLIVVLTPAWYGVETPDGHHGWIRRSQLENLP
jgi:hypothetical protein